MRSLLTGLAVALMATTAFGATAHVTMTVGGSADYTPAPGETFRVDVNITADAPMSAWGCEPIDSLDAGYTVAATVLGGYYGNLAMNYSDDPPGPPVVNLQGWDTNSFASAKSWPAGVVNDLNLGAPTDFRPGSAAVNLAAGATSGFAVYFMLTAPASDVETVILLEDVFAGDLAFNAMEVTYDPLNLPEPTSLVLLLAGLPLLRRRR